LPNGVSYQNQDKAKQSEKIKLVIDLKKLNIREAIKKILDVFDVIDIEVYDVDLEEVIREMYAKNK
jgi:ABC-type uncharacterized transport system ATPase subunit